MHRNHYGCVEDPNRKPLAQTRLQKLQSPSLLHALSSPSVALQVLAISLGRHGADVARRLNSGFLVPIPRPFPTAYRSPRETIPAGKRQMQINRRPREKEACR